MKWPTPEVLELNNGSNSIIELPIQVCKRNKSGDQSEETDYKS